MDRRTGKFAGYCHVVFESATDAKWVVEEIDGAMLHERSMKLDFAPDGGRQQDVDAAAGKIEWQAPDQSADNPTAEVRCFVGNLPFSMGTETALQEAFSLVGAEVRDVYIPTDRYATTSEPLPYALARHCTPLLAVDRGLPFACTAMCMWCCLNCFDVTWLRAGLRSSFMALCSSTS
jgi:RNA recognition motif-containing protein